MKSNNFCNYDGGEQSRANQVMPRELEERGMQTKMQHHMPQQRDESRMVYLQVRYDTTVSLYTMQLAINEGLDKQCCPNEV